MVSFGLTNFESIFGLHALDKYAYGPKEVGMIMVVIGLVSAVAQGTLIGPLTRRWGEVRIIRACLLASSIGFILMLLPATYAGVLITTGLFILSVTLLRPVLMALISKQATIGQGAAMGLNNAFMSLGRIVGPLWAGIAFDMNISYPYISGSAIMFAGFLISLATIKQEEPKTAVVDLQTAVD